MNKYISLTFEGFIRNHSSLLALLSNISPLAVTVFLAQVGRKKTRNAETLQVASRVA